MLTTVISEWKVTPRLTAKHTTHVYIRTNFYSLHCPHSDATLYIDLGDINVGQRYHNTQEYKQCSTMTSPPEQMCRVITVEKDAWLTCIWSIPIKILAEVEGKLGVVEWQLQVFAVIPEGTVLISFNLSPAFVPVKWKWVVQWCRDHSPWSDEGVTKLIKPLLL